MTNEEKFRAMWKWLSENRGKCKEDYLNSIGIVSVLEEKYPTNECYACEETLYRTYGNEYRPSNCRINCENCPITWSSLPYIYKSEDRCMRNDSLFFKWEWNFDDGEYEDSCYDKACEIAKQISEMPWN